MQATHVLPNQLIIEANLTGRWNEGFKSHERGIAQLAVSKAFANNEISAAYNLNFVRNGQKGEEHRMWQQISHMTEFSSGTLESSARLEERFFTDTHHNGRRLRVLNRITYPLDSGNAWRLGHEWVVNLDDIQATTQRGVSQNRLIAAFLHPLPGGQRLSLEYQLRYQHLAGPNNAIQHQVQLQYSFSY